MASLRKSIPSRSSATAPKDLAEEAFNAAEGRQTILKRVSMEKTAADRMSWILNQTREVVQKDAADVASDRSTEIYRAPEDFRMPENEEGEDGFGD